MVEATQGLFPGAENMVSDESRSVGPRSTSTENRLHVNGKPMERTLLIQGNKVCTAEVSSSGGAPCSPSQGCYDLHAPPFHGITGQSRASSPESARIYKDHIGHPLSVKSPVNQCSLFPRHPCRSARHWTHTQLLEGYQACPEGHKHQAPK